MISLYVFILGLVLGSFLNVVIDRLPRGEKLTGRSHCEHCQKTLVWKDLIPVVSYLWLRGRCRYCHAKLSPKYLILEFTTGVLFLLYSLLFPMNLWPFGLTVISILIVIFVIDLKYGIIPDKIIFPSLPFIVIFLIVFGFPLFNHLLSALGAFFFFYLLYLITHKKGMGFGDVKFALLIGLVFGFPGTIFALYIAFLTGGLIGTILVLWGKKNLKTAVPFGPFLVIGSLLVLFFQSQIQDLVIKLF